jgi:hypothetical protein
VVEPRIETWGATADTAVTRPPGDGRLGPVWWFFALAYALTWAWWVPVAFAQPAVERGDG